MKTKLEKICVMLLVTIALVLSIGTGEAAAQCTVAPEECDFNVATSCILDFSPNASQFTVQTENDTSNVVEIEQDNGNCQPSRIQATPGERTTVVNCRSAQTSAELEVDEVAAVMTENDCE